MNLNNLGLKSGRKVGPSFRRLDFCLPPTPPVSTTRAHGEKAETEAANRQEQAECGREGWHTSFPLTKGTCSRVGK